MAIPVLSDNFAFLVYRRREALLIDAGEAKPILQVLRAQKLLLQEILITHHHYDHIGGWVQLQQHVTKGTVQHVSHVEAIATPGHMMEHFAYYLPEAAALFPGDALINGGCGRLLGGTAEQFFASLQKIGALPDDTRVFGGHDYLSENLRFALSLEPDNPYVQRRLDAYHFHPAKALFATLGEEKLTNPFLRVETVEDFAELRRLKDDF